MSDKKVIPLFKNKKTQVPETQAPQSGPSEPKYISRGKIFKPKMEHPTLSSQLQEPVKMLEELQARFPFLIEELEA